MNIKIIPAGDEPRLLVVDSDCNELCDVVYDDQPEEVAEKIVKAWNKCTMNDDERFQDIRAAADRDCRTVSSGDIRWVVGYAVRLVDAVAARQAMLSKLAAEMRETAKLLHSVPPYYQGLADGVCRAEAIIRGKPEH